MSSLDMANSHFHPTQIPGCIFMSPESTYFKSPDGCISEVRDYRYWESGLLFSQTKKKDQPTIRQPTETSFRHFNGKSYFAVGQRKKPNFNTGKLAKQTFWETDLTIVPNYIHSQEMAIFIVSSVLGENDDSGWTYHPVVSIERDRDAEPPLNSWLGFALYSGIAYPTIQMFGAGTNDSVNTAAVNSPMMLAGVFAPSEGTATMSVNGGEISYIYNNTIYRPTKSFTINTPPNFPYYGVVDVGCVFVCDRALFTPELESKLFGWAAHYYQLAHLLPSNHIYRNNPPVN